MEQSHRVSICELIENRPKLQYLPRTGSRQVSTYRDSRVIHFKAFWQKSWKEPWSTHLIITINNNNIHEETCNQFWKWNDTTCPEYIWIVNPMLLSTLSDSLSWCSCYSTGTHLGKKEINVYHYPDILNTLISSTIQIS